MSDPDYADLEKRLREQADAAERDYYGANEELMREAADAIAALARRLEACEWQPIETAPKGVRILIWNGAPYFAQWSDECAFGQFETGPFYSYGTVNATHWRAVPGGPDLSTATSGEEKP